MRNWNNTNNYIVTSTHVTIAAIVISVLQKALLEKVMNGQEKCEIHK